MSLMGLPTELRHKIFRLIFADHFRIPDRSEAGKTTVALSFRDKHSLLAISRRCRAEAYVILIHHVEIYFKIPDISFFQPGNNSLPRLFYDLMSEANMLCLDNGRFLVRSSFYPRIDSLQIRDEIWRVTSTNPDVVESHPAQIAMPKAGITAPGSFAIRLRSWVRCRSTVFYWSWHPLQHYFWNFRGGCAAGKLYVLWSSYEDDPDIEVVDYIITNKSF